MRYAAVLVLGVTCTVAGIVLLVGGGWMTGGALCVVGLALFYSAYRSAGRE